MGRVWAFYRDGFRGMGRLGRTLWAVILVKLFVMFFVLKLFFFPNVIKERAADGDQASYVASQILSANKD